MQYTHCHTPYVIKCRTDFVNLTVLTPNIFFPPGALGTGESDMKTLLDSGDGLNGVSGGGLTLLAWDPPGYGKSTPPKRTFPVDFLDRDAKEAAAFMETMGEWRQGLIFQRTDAGLPKIS